MGIILLFLRPRNSILNFVSFHDKTRLFLRVPDTQNADITSAIFCIHEFSSNYSGTPHGRRRYAPVRKHPYPHQKLIIFLFCIFYISIMQNIRESGTVLRIFRTIIHCKKSGI